MKRISDAIGGIIDDFAEAKKDSLDLSIAAKESFLAQDLQSRAASRLAEQFEQAPEGAFNADAQIDWYDTEVEKLLFNITNKDQRVKFKELLNRSRGNYAIDANKLEMKSLQEQEVKTLQKGHDSYTLAIANAGDSRTIDTLLMERLTQVQHYKDAASRTKREKLDTYEDQEILTAFSRKADLLKSSFSLNKIDRDQYIQGMEGLEKDLLGNGMLDVLDGASRVKAIQDVRNLKQAALEGAQALELLTIENDFAGEVARIKAGFDPDLGFANKLFSAAARDKENIALQNKASAYRSAIDFVPFFKAKSIGDLSTMVALKNGLKAEVESGVLRGAEYNARANLLNEIGATVINFRELMQTNSAEAFKNHPAMKQAALAVAQNPNSLENRDLLVKTQLELARAQGMRDEDVEFLTEEALAYYASQFSGDIGVLEAEARYQDILENNSTPVGVKTAGQIMLEQLSRRGGFDMLAARYTETRSFGPIYQATRMSDEKLKSLWAKGETDRKGLLSEVIERITPYIEAEKARVPDNPEYIADLQQAAVKLAMYAPLDPSYKPGMGKGPYDHGSAAEFAIDHLFKSHIDVVKKRGMTVQVPKKDMEAQAFQQKLSYFSKNEILRGMIKAKAQTTGGLIQLRGDVTPMINTAATGVQALPSIDFENMVQTGELVTSNRGIKALINTEGGNLPMGLSDGKGGVVVIDMSWAELNEAFAVTRASTPSGSIFLSETGEIQIK